jgi:hypothetical protein
MKYVASSFASSPILLLSKVLNYVNIAGPDWSKYPHYFRNTEGFTFAAACQGLPLLEHPVNPRVPYDYTGGTPGAYRLILAYNDQGNQAMYVQIWLSDTKGQLTDFALQFLRDGCARPPKYERFCQMFVSGVIGNHFLKQKPSQLETVML